MAARRIVPRRRPVDCTLSAPPSKSVTHRALIAAALATGESIVERPLDAVDTRVTADGLAALGARVSRADGAWVVGGPIPSGGEARIDLRESGSSMRFLAAVAALTADRATLDGASRLRERPMDELYDALGGLGARVDRPANGRSLPVAIARGSIRGGRVVLPGERSSQFATALLLVGSRLEGGIEVTLGPPAVSLRYVEVTERVLRAFGVSIERVAETTWRVHPGDARGTRFVVDGDHSSATYPMAAAAIRGGRARIDRLDPDSSQPDAAFAAILERLGCTVERGTRHVEIRAGARIAGFTVDLSGSPDIAPTVAVLALVAHGESRIANVAHLRFKESDRLALLAENLRALGRPARVEGDDLVVDAAPSGGVRGGATVRTAGDHRMAMAFAVAGLVVPGVTIDDDACVDKSYPDFWKDFEGIANA